MESRREVSSERVVNTCLVVGSPPDPTYAVIINHIMTLMETIMLASVQARMIAPWKMMNDSFLHEADVPTLRSVYLHQL